VTGLAVLAGSCFPDCHPAGQQVSTVSSSGYAALGLAFVALLIMVLTGKRGRG